MQQEKNIKEVKPASFKGFPLFNEIEDDALRLRNQAVIMTNLLEDNFFKGKISAKGASLIAGYMRNIPHADRKSLMDEFVEQAKLRGFEI